MINVTNCELNKNIIINITQLMLKLSFKLITFVYYSLIYCNDS